MPLNLQEREASELSKQDFERMLAGETACLIVRNFMDSKVSRCIARSIEASPELLVHEDVPGLKVFGLSHFQAVRSPDLADLYSELGQKLRSLLVRYSEPDQSPFEHLLQTIEAATDFSVEALPLRSGVPIAPFTIRVCELDVGIEPHQDILSAEIPGEPVAESLDRQIAVNIFLAAPKAGGLLEMFELDTADTGYKNLNEGPKSVPIEDLPRPAISVRPNDGDLLFFDSSYVHRVVENAHKSSRITLACFLGVQEEIRRLVYWV